MLSPCASCHAVDKKPLKVFLLAGQFNMEGHASIGTFELEPGWTGVASLLNFQCLHTREIGLQCF